MIRSNPYGGLDVLEGVLSLPMEMSRGMWITTRRIDIGRYNAVFDGVLVQYVLRANHGSNEGSIEADKGE